MIDAPLQLINPERKWIDRDIFYRAMSSAAGERDSES